MIAHRLDAAAALSTWKTAVDLVRDVLRFRPRQVATIAALTLVNGVTEALGFTALIPLLGLVGLAQTPDTGSVIGPLLRWLTSITGKAPGLESALAVFFLAIVLRAVSGYAGARLTADFVAARTDHIRRRLYNEHSRASWLHLTQARRSVDTHALTMLAEGSGYIVVNLVALFSSVVLAVSGLAVAFLLAPRLTLLLLSFAVLMAIPLALVQVSTYRRGEAALHAMQRLYDVIDSRMTGVKLAKAFAIEADLERDFAEASDAYRLAMTAMRETAARARLLQDIAAAVALVAFAYVGVRLFSAGSLELVVLVAISARVFPLVNAVQAAARSLVASLPDYEALRCREEDARAAAEPRPDRLDPLPLADAVELRDVSFAYPETTDAPVLENVSIRIPAHQSIGVLGASGAGKTTFVDIVAGLIVADRGDILVDGTVIAAKLRPHWRKAIAYVPQDAALLHDSVRVNITLGATGTGDAEIWKCLDLVGAKDLVEHLPQGLETIVGERGTRLSGGQRQRLRLASALLRRPALLILDEATNALSPKDEEDIVAALRKLRESTTMIIVSHRTSTIAWTDLTLVLGERRIIDAGATSEILARHAGRAGRDIASGK